MTAPLTTCRCPRCGYDLSGVVESWSEQCPVVGACSECGLCFVWRELLSHDVRLALRPYDDADSPCRMSLWESAWVLIAHPARFWRMSSRNTRHSLPHGLVIAAVTSAMMLVLGAAAYLAIGAVTAAIIRLHPATEIHYSLAQILLHCLGTLISDTYSLGDAMLWPFIWLWGWVAHTVFFAVMLAFLRGDMGLRPLRHTDILRAWVLTSPAMALAFTLACLFQHAATACYIHWDYTGQSASVDPELVVTVLQLAAMPVVLATVFVLAACPFLFWVRPPYRIASVVLVAIMSLLIAAVPARVLADSVYSLLYP